MSDLTGSLNMMSTSDMKELVLVLEEQLQQQRAAAKWTREDIRFIQRRIAEREMNDVDADL